MPVCHGRIQEIRVQASAAMAALVYLQGRNVRPVRSATSTVCKRAAVTWQETHGREPYGRREVYLRKIRGGGGHVIRLPCRDRP